MLRIRRPFVTVAGETAPSPGITILGDTIKIRTHDVVLRHLRIRVGADGPTAPKERDGIQIIGAADGSDPSYNILIENCSISWSVDELVSIWGEGNHDIAIRSSFLTEALKHSIHPEGAHSTGLMIDSNTRRVLVQGNLFAHNSYRNPLVAGGAEAMIVNNLVYNPGGHAIHFNAHRKSKGPTRATIIGNVVIAGPSTSNKPRLSAFDGGLPDDSNLFYRDNVSDGTVAFDPAEAIAGSGLPIPFVPEPPVWLPAGRVFPSGRVESRVLRKAGARPLDRDAVDARIVEEVRTRSGAIRDIPSDLRLAPRL
jgi:hypothetical protein